MNPLDIPKIPERTGISINSLLEAQRTLDPYLIAVEEKEGKIILRSVGKGKIITTISTAGELFAFIAGMKCKQ